MTRNRILISLTIYMKMTAVPTPRTARAECWEEARTIRTDSELTQRGLSIYDRYAKASLWPF